MILTAVRGDKTVFAPFTLLEAGEPIDLSGLTLAFTAKANLLDADDDALIAKTEVDGLEIAAEPDTGVVTLTLLPEDTDQLADATRLYWDIQADDGIGNVRTPLKGKLVITGDVTRSASVTS